MRLPYFVFILAEVMHQIYIYFSLYNRYSHTPLIHKHSLRPIKMSTQKVQYAKRIKNPSPPQKKMMSFYYKIFASRFILIKFIRHSCNQVNSVLVGLRPLNNRNRLLNMQMCSYFQNVWFSLLLR